LKTATQIEAAIRNRLERTWARDIEMSAPSWPHQFPLGAPSKSDLENDWQTYQQAIRMLKDWKSSRGATVTLITEPRRVFSTTQDIPTHARVEDSHAAAHILDGGPSGPWAKRLDRAEVRHQTIASAFPSATGIARILQAADTWDDTEFHLLLQVARWFEENASHAVGLTPRQVPIPGVHAKWLNTSGPHLLALTGLPALGLAGNHPPRIHFTYLDPGHLAAAGRAHDSATVGDAFTPAYPPKVVVISENKDTAIHFMPVPGGIAVEGNGFGGKTAAAFRWLTEAPHLYYWGDIDCHGYEILNGWRADGVPVDSILMDSATYEAYEQYGTSDSGNGHLQAGERKTLLHLTGAERAMYERLTDPLFTGHRRIEQERIPLTVAATAVMRALLAPSKR
jgi:hypothetical protein